MPHNGLTRRSFNASLAGAAASTVAAAQSARPRKRPPNVVFFLYDDLGSADLGCYGQQTVRTPHSDRLAREGMRFTQAYAGATVCAPSRCCLMTGYHTGHAAVRANAGTVPLRPDDVTLPQLLKQQGYTTGAFGKWGLGDVRSTGAAYNKGFDEFFGYLHQTHAHSYYPEFLWHNAEKVMLPGNATRGRAQYSADLIADKMYDFVRRNRQQPFFLYASITLPHAYFEGPSMDPYAAEPWPESDRHLAAMITRADAMAGRLMAMLREYELERDTIFFIASDNGGPPEPKTAFSRFRRNGSLRGWKGQMYEGGIRVPMIVRWPGRIPAGAVSDHPWAFWDVLPTLGEVAGFRPPAGIDGRSAWPALQSKKQAAPEMLYWEHYGYDQKAGQLRNQIQAARMGDWKAVRPRQGAPLEIYNLAEDPAEAVDRAAAKPDLVRRFEDRMRAAHTEPRPHNNGNWPFAT